ncbi:MAG: DUF3794 domain-containing protein [Ruminococcaceae bacterium]|nr:DUF3794 domain-containing protein [Oscillospiraceae bacterium]
MPEKSCGEINFDHRMLFTSDLEKSEDFTLPEYYDDMQKVLNVSTRSRLNGKYVGSKNVDIDGEILYSVCFLNSANRIRNVIYSTPVEESFEIDGISEASNICVSIKVLNYNHRMLGPRKINLRSKLQCRIAYTIKKNCDPEILGKYNIDDEKNIEKKYIDKETSDVLTYEENGNELTETFEVENGEDGIADVISCNMNISVCDVLYSGNGITHVKCCGFFNGLFETESGEYVSKCKKISFDKDCTTPDFDESVVIEAFAEIRDMKLGINEDNVTNEKLAEFECTYDISLCGAVPKKVRLCTDAYSTICDDKLCRDKIKTVSVSASERNSFSLNMQKEKKDLGINGEILYLNATPYIDAVNYNSEKGRAVITGTCTVKGISKDDDRSVASFEYKEPFRFEMPFAKDEREHSYSFACSVVWQNFTDEGEKLFCDVETEIGLTEFLSEFSDALVSIELSSPIVFDPDENGIKIYYPDKAEELWDIAKKYRLKCSELCSVNRISDERNKCGDILLIPNKHRGESIYSKII